MVERGDVLIVEDHEENRDIFKTILEFGGYGVVLAEDGLEGLEAVERTRPALVILDIGLPRLSGWGFLQRLRDRDDPLRDTPVMVVTADTSEESRRRSVGMGCVDFLTKPVEPRYLLDRVHAALEQQVA